MSKIAPCLWFNGDAEPAANLYVSLHPGSAVGAISRYGEGMPLPPETALLAEFTLAGQRFQVLTGAPNYRHSEPMSRSISCKDAAEADRYWNSLTADGGAGGPCGWLKDRIGMPWQIVPDGLGRLKSDSDKGRAARAMQAMMAMKKARSRRSSRCGRRLEGARVNIL